MGRKTKQNKITNPELISQINPKNVRLMNDFLEYLRSIGKAESTVKAYTSDLYIFFVWVLQNADNKYFPEVTKRDIISYQNWLLRSNENSPARVRRLKSTLSSLSNYIEAGRGNKGCWILQKRPVNLSGICICSWIIYGRNLLKVILEY